MKKAIFISSIILLISAGPVLACAYFDDVEIYPENTTSCDTVLITLSGHTSCCIITDWEFFIDGNDMYLGFVWDEVSFMCDFMVWPWEFSRTTGPLAPGKYNL